MASKIKSFIANHWVSWLIEIIILSAVAYYTISETQKTAEQTRAMLAKYDAAITQYVSEKSTIVDRTVKSSIDSTKEKAKSLKIEDVKNLMDSLKSEKNQ